ncbi:MAG: PilX N-terminal domain-containing pilus assembly protein [Pseudomonadota bacterium]
MSTTGVKLKNLQRFRYSLKYRQQGVSLILSLIFLVVLSLLGLSAIQNSTLQERMSNNLRDRNIALQAAELALRDAERDLASKLADNATFCAAGTTVNGVTCRPIGARPDNVADQQGYWRAGSTTRATWTPGCIDGQCFSIENSGSATPVWDDTAANWAPQAGSTGAFPTTQYGTYTGATPIGNVSAQPRYIMEIFPASLTDFYGTSGTQRVTIRITVRAVGQNPNTVVVLQSLVAPY